MVREYFESVLQENGGRIAEYAAKIEEQQLELKSVEKKIVKIQSKKEFDVGYFSPRRSENSLREQLGNFRKVLEEVEELEKKAKK